MFVCLALGQYVVAGCQGSLCWTRLRPPVEPRQSQSHQRSPPMHGEVYYSMTQPVINGSRTV